MCSLPSAEHLGAHRLIFAALYAGGMLFGLGSAYFVANSEVPEYGQLGTLLVGAVIALAWAIVPIFFSGLDGTLDESRFVLFPIKPSTLQKGQFLGGFVGIPGIASIIAVLLGAIAFISQPLALVVYLICCVLGPRCEPHGVGAPRQPPGHGAER